MHVHFTSIAFNWCTVQCNTKILLSLSFHGNGTRLSSVCVRYFGKGQEVWDHAVVPGSNWSTLISASTHTMNSSISPISEITSCDATIEDCHFGPPATGDSNEEVAPYSCSTLVVAEIHPQPPTTLKDAPTPLPQDLAPPNLVVAQPSECHETPTPPLPPPRNKDQPTWDEWEMTYADLLLKGGLGWGNSGIVVQGILAKDKDRKAIERVARLEMAQEGGCEQWTVAVKCVKGASVLLTLKEGFCQYII